MIISRRKLFVQLTICIIYIVVVIVIAKRVLHTSDTFIFNHNVGTGVITSTKWTKKEINR